MTNPPIKLNLIHFFPFWVDREKLNNCYVNVIGAADDVSRRSFKYVYILRKDSGDILMFLLNWGWRSLPGRSKTFHLLGNKPPLTQIRCVAEWRHRCTWVSVKGKGTGQGRAEKKTKKKQQRQPRHEGRDGRWLSLCLSGQLDSRRFETIVGTVADFCRSFLGRGDDAVWSRQLLGWKADESGSPTSGCTTGTCRSRILLSFCPVYSSSKRFFFFITIIFYLLWMWHSNGLQLRLQLNEVQCGPGRAARQVVYVLIEGFFFCCLFSVLYFSKQGQQHLNP